MPPDQPDPQAPPRSAPGDDPEELELAVAFERHRPHLRAVAHRVLGSAHEAEDAVQDAWLRLARTPAADRAAIDNLAGWLTTVVSRLCLDRLRARGTRREEELTDRSPATGTTPDPVAEAELGDSVGAAMLVVLETLSPAERLAFVLHDLFGLPFEEVATITGRSTAAVRQLASRGRRRVQGPDPVRTEARAAADRRRQHEVVAAFLAASREGDLAGLVDLLDPGARVRADAVAAAMGAPALTTGVEAVAATFSGRARAARLTLIDGYAGLTWSLRGEVKIAFAFTLGPDDRVAEIELLGDPEVLGVMDLRMLPVRGDHP